MLIRDFLTLSAQQMFAWHFLKRVSLSFVLCFKAIEWAWNNQSVESMCNREFGWMRLYWVHPKTTSFPGVWQIRIIHGKTAEMSKCLLAPQMKRKSLCYVCCKKKKRKKISFLRTRMRKSQEKVELRKNENTKWGENRSANCTANKQPPFWSGGKIALQYVQLDLHTHTQYCHNAVFLQRDEQHSTSSSHPPLLNVFPWTLSNQAAVRLLPFCSREQCCGGVTTQNATLTSGPCCQHDHRFNYVNLLHEVVFATGAIAKRWKNRRLGHLRK